MFRRILVALFILTAPARAADPPPGFPRFETQEVVSDLKIGYAVLTADLNGDQRPDIVIVDKERVIWLENPTWKVRTILQGKTKPDNVCACALDIDGGGDLELVVGAGWKPFDTKTPGTLQWLKRGKTLDEEWTLHPIPCDEPTVHRVQAADLDGDGKPEVVMAPLMGREATAKGNWTDGRPVRIVSYPVPAEPTKAENWKPAVVSDTLHVVHNFTARPLQDGLPSRLTAVSYDGVHFLVPNGGGPYHARRVGTGDQSNPAGSRGASEVAVGRLRIPAEDRLRYPVVATVEPWHGNKLVVYTPPADAPPPGGRTYPRHVIDSQLRWGHAIKFADLDGDGTEELIAGVRDDPNPKQGDTFTERRGVRLYRNTDGKGEKWDRFILDSGGVAVEDLTVADLNADGRPDIVAVGRATGNCRIYWNKGK